MQTFIAALGARYDGDSHIGFIQMGILGFWGEWHTYPKTSWFPGLVVQEEILGAFDTAFSRTPLVDREIICRRLMDMRTRRICLPLDLLGA